MFRFALQQVALTVLVLCGMAAHAAGSVPGDGTYEDAACEKDREWSICPVLASSPETGLMLGGRAFWFVPGLQNCSRASVLDMMAYGTTEQQYRVLVGPELFLQEGRYRVKAELSLWGWRANFYPIGNDSSDEAEEYDANNVKCDFLLERYFAGSWLLGLIGKCDSEDIEPSEGGALEAGAVDGADGGEYVGVGAVCGYDSRDSNNAPHCGSYARYEFVSYNSDTGSDLNFALHTLDIRQYVPTSENTTLALRGQVRASRGDVPFRYLSAPDGTWVLRGLENRRYADQDMVAVQSEFRFPIKNRFSGTAFAEIAQVAEEVARVRGDRFKTSIGAGLRFALNPEQRLNVRADVGWVDDGVGLILNFREAF